jgi:hypothetical protein
MQYLNKELNFSCSLTNICGAYYCKFALLLYILSSFNYTDLTVTLDILFGVFVLLFLGPLPINWVRVKVTKTKNRFPPFTHSNDIFLLCQNDIGGTVIDVIYIFFSF